MLFFQAALVSLSFLFLIRYPEIAPWSVGLGLLLSLYPLIRAWRGSVGTGLRPAVIWGGISIGLALIAEVVATGESVQSGRPGSNQWLYLSVLAALAALLTVLNARTPGGGAWAILMTMLVVVFLLPWLEGAGLARQRDGWDRVRLASPWTYFFGILVFAAITNYLPTRFGLASLIALAGFVLAGLGLSRTDWSLELRGRVWAWVPWCWSLTLLVADLQSRTRRIQANSLTEVWLWFRDHWGTVWALRTRDRFNRTAELAGWPFRLDWTGVIGTPGSSSNPPIPEEAVATLVNLLRRFAESSRLDEVVRRSRGVDLANSIKTGDYSIEIHRGGQ